MEEFSNHNRICAVPTKIAQACKRAREIYANTYRGIFSVNDQAHVIYLLIHDIGKL